MRSKEPGSSQDKVISSTVQQRTISWDVNAAGEKELYNLVAFPWLWLCRKTSAGQPGSSSEQPELLFKTLFLPRYNSEQHYCYGLLMNNECSPWRIQWTFCNIILLWFGPSSSQGSLLPHSDSFDPVYYYSASDSCPCVIACLMLDVGHLSYWTHLGHCFQSSFALAIYIINIPVISCSYSTEMILLSQLHEASNEKNTELISHFIFTP